MEIRQIKYFIQICKDKSFSKAAENLHISQQGLSKAIKNLEEELEISLLYRSTKGVNPTESGKLLLERSQKIVSEFDLLVGSLYDKAKLERGIIAIGLPHILNINLFATIICEFQDTYPNIKLEIIELSQSLCEKKIEDNLLDISFAAKPVDTKKFKFIPIFSCDVMLLVNKENSLARKNVVNFKDLENEKFIMLSPECKSRKLIIECCILSGFKPNIVFETSQIAPIIDLVSLNKGIAILPNDANFLKATKISDKVSVVSFQDTPFKVEVGFIINRFQSLNYITNTLISYTLNFFTNKEV